MRRTITNTLSLISLIGLLSACAGSADTQSTDSSPTPTETSPTVVAPTSQPDDSANLPSEVPIDPDEIVLTVWITEPLSTASEAPGGEVLSAQLASFDDTHPNIRVEVHLKAASGPGSIMTYLQTAPPVAPDVVPDLVLMDRDTLFQAARDELVVPVGELADPATLTDLYPAARQLATLDDLLIGMPYVLQTQHVVYRETLFQEPPNSYERLLDSPVPFVFPAGTLSNINRTLITQYMAAGGILIDEEGNPAIDRTLLIDLLTFYDAAHEDEIVDPALFQITSTDRSWELYNGRQAALATVTSTAYLANRAEERSTGFTWIPTADGEPFTLLTGWMWAVTTRDPDRQDATMSLLNFLLNPVNHGTYTQAAGWLPSQSSALAVWGDDDTYAPFVDTLLAAAQPLPEPSQRAVSGAAIQEALEDILLNDSTPLQATTQAEQKVNPGGDDG